MRDERLSQVRINPHNYRFCPKCGQELVVVRVEETPRLRCSSCAYIFYQNPIPAVGAVLMVDDSVLLVKRKYEPKAGAWCLPAGFLEFGESLTDGLVREVKEETNLEIAVGDLLTVCNAMDDPRSHVVLVVYWGEILNGQVEAGDDALDAHFFPLDALPENIAFACHARALQMVKESFANRFVP